MALIITGPLVDMHVHLREPGQTHKETIASGTRAALRGGFGAVLAMPNTAPPVDSPELVKWVLDRAAETGSARVLVAAAITAGQKGEVLTDFAALKAAGATALSDDGVPVLDRELMRRAMLEARRVGLPILSHCEPETELAARDAELAAETGCPVHICHVSRRATVEAIRAAKSAGAPVTAETCPHYMVAWAEGKMNPPLASPDDVEAVLEGLCDGTLDAISTDHAPHTAQEKASASPPNGVIGLETALAVALMSLVHTGRASSERLWELMRDNPARILGITPPKGKLVMDTEREWTAENFQSLSSNTPFAGKILKGAVISCRLTD